MTIRVLLADDYPPFRRIVRSCLEMEDDFTVVGEAGNGDEALAEALRLKPQVVIMDWLMPGTGGCDATRQLSFLLPQTRVIILTFYSNLVFALEARQAGAGGYILKDDTVEHLAPCVRAVVSGQEYFSPRIKALIDPMPEQAGPRPA